jgi:hypothetical protein
MKPSDYNLNINNFKKKIQTFEKQGKEMFFTTYFFTGKTKEMLTDKAPVELLNLIPDNLKCDSPDKIRIELYDAKDAIHCLYPREYKRIIIEPVLENPPVQFKGFGEIEINSIVDQRFRERQQQEEYAQLKQNVLTLTTELEEQQDLVADLEAENERLEQELENKKQVRYYAGMLGDILEGIGISKDKIRNPIASLMGIADDAKSMELSSQPSQTTQATQTQHDQSGIVEEQEAEPITKEERERNEVISLITDYMNAVDNKILGRLFIIFSEIEQDSDKALEIITFLKTPKA